MFHDTSINIPAELCKTIPVHSMFHHLSIFFGLSITKNKWLVKLSCPFFVHINKIVGPISYWSKLFRIFGCIKVTSEDMFQHVLLMAFWKYAFHISSILDGESLWASVIKIKLPILIPVIVTVGKYSDCWTLCSSPTWCLQLTFLPGLQFTGIIDILWGHGGI